MKRYWKVESMDGGAVRKCKEGLTGRSFIAFHKLDIFAWRVERSLVKKEGSGPALHSTIVTEVHGFLYCILKRDMRCGWDVIQWM